MLLAACASLAAPLAAAAPFGLKDVDALATQRAATSFKDPGGNLPGPLLHLDHDRYHAIRFKPEAAAWAKHKRPFTLEFFHEGWAFDRPVAIHEITPQGVHDFAFDPQQFDYAAAQLDPNLMQGLGYAGFRANYALNLPQYRDELIAFLGASYFRALGKGQHYGLSARGLAIDTAQASGEEFPRFVEFWVERPKPGARRLVVYALLDSPRATGAYRFAIEPGADTVVEVSARLHLRERIDKLGLAPLTSMFFFGADQRGGGGDFRPEVHDSDGLSIRSDAGEWIWRPLVNPKRLLVTSFALTNPRGFGLMQRERDFARYEDLDNRYDLRPSAWVEPIGDWGAGRVELVQIPGPDETNDNIVAYWVPQTMPAPQQAFALDYRIHWQKDAPATPPTAHVVQTRRGKLPRRDADATVGFVVDFAGPLEPSAATDAAADVELSTDANAELVQRTLEPNAVTGGWRLRLRVHRLDDTKPVELRARLRRGDAVSETWSYVLPPG
ncbi:MAG TPA: glucan biosynthesis protein G [Dokdonella sp.]